MVSWRFRGRIAAMFTLVAATSLANAQVPLAAPDVAIGNPGRINAIARQSDGSLIIGGEFTRVDGVARRNLARLYPDGTLDTTWNASTDKAVYSVAVDAHDDVFASGAFDIASGEPRAAFAKFGGHGTGAIDPAWNPGASVTSTYSPPKIALGADGSVFAYQSDFLVDTADERRIIKIAPAGTGTVDFSWNPTVPYVTAVAADRSGALYLGAFGSGADGCVRKVSTGGSGAAIAGWHVSLGTDCRPWELATAADGTLYASSDVPFETGGGGQRYIVRFAPGSQGEIDANWSPDVSQPVLALVVDNDAIHANLRPVDGRAGAVAKIAADTGATRWQVPASYVYALAVGGDGSLYAGGEFWEPDNPAPGGQPKMSLVRMASADGAPLPAVDAARPGSVNAIARQPDGGLIVAGSFERAGTTPRRNLLRLTPAGALDPAWNAPIDTGVAAIAVDANGNVYAGLTGSDNTVAPIRRFSAGDGTLDPTWSASVGGNGDLGASIGSLVLDGHGHLYVLGSFERVGGALRPGLARFAAESGTLDTWSAPAAAAWANALIVAPDGMLYVARSTTAYAGPTPIYFGEISRIDPDSDAATTAWTRSFTGLPSALAIAPDGSLFAGGYFEVDGPHVTSDVLKLSPQGEIDAEWTAATASTDDVRTALALELDAQGHLYIGGSRSGIDGYGSYLVRRTIADAALDGAWQPAIVGDVVHRMLLASPDVLIVAGQFGSIGDTPRDSLAALALPPTGEPPTNPHSTHARPPINAPRPSPSPARLRPGASPP